VPARDASSESLPRLTTARDPENRLELVIGGIRDHAIFMLDPSGRIDSWNLGAQAIKGYTADEVIGKTIDIFYTREDVAAGKPAALIAEARLRGQAEDLGWRVRKDGSRFWADCVLTAIHDRDGALLGFAKITRDLTERREAETARLAEAARFQTLVESAREYAIFMLDPTGHVMTWNPGAQRIKGYTADEIIGQHFSRFYPDGDGAVAQAKCEAELAQALAEGKFEEEGWRVRKDGSQFWAHVVLAPLRDRAGHLIGFSKITRDLTELRRAEQDRLKLVQTEEALRLRDEFLSIAAHELRTPLVALELQIDSLLDQRDQFDAKFHSKLERAGRNVERLADLIATLLDVSRISTGHLTIAPQKIDLGKLVREVVDRLEDAATAARCTLKPSVADGIVGYWDPLRVGQVVTNLLGNAFRYAAGTEVEIRLTREDETAVLCVADRGPGIPDDQRERIFERFERAGAARQHGGMGLGLYVARQIVAAHQGTISAKDREGSGAVLEVRLPIRQTASHARK
jgi:PAS domain S-box-containing protein